MDALLVPYGDQLWDAIGSRNRPTADGRSHHSSMRRSQAFTAQQDPHLFEPLHSAAAVVDTQHQVTVRATAVATNSSSSGITLVTPFNRLPSLPAASGRPAAGADAAAAAASTAFDATMFADSGTSSGPSSMLQRHSGSNSFLGATASQLLSTLTASLSLLGSSPRSRSSSVSSSTSSSSSWTTLGRLRSGRNAPLVRAAAALLQESEAEESYDDLLALDQFNVKRGVKPLVVASLPRRLPSERDRQHHAQCLICLEAWAPAAPPAAAHDGSSCTAWSSKLSVEAGLRAGTAAGAGVAHAQHSRDCCVSSRHWDQHRSGSRGAHLLHQAPAQHAVPQAASQVIQVLPCGHEFCCGCIVTWLLEHATCPVCRWTFPEESTRLLNMHK